jgi:hypothetical protein
VPLMAARVLLGVGEGVAFPAIHSMIGGCVHTCTRKFPGLSVHTQQQVHTSAETCRQARFATFRAHTAYQNVAACQLARTSPCA